MKSIFKRHSKLFDYFGYQSLQMAIGIIALPILTRVLSIEDYGVVSVASAAAVMAFSIAFQWIQFVIGRTAMQADKTNQESVGISLTEIALSILCSVAFLVATGWITHLPLEILILLSVLVPLYATIFIGMEIVYMRQESTRYRRLGNGYSLLKQVLGIGVATLFGLGATGYLFGWLLATIIITALLFRQTRMNAFFSLSQWSVKNARTRVQYGYSFAVVGIIESAVIFLPTSVLAGQGMVELVAQFSILWMIASAAVYLIPSVYVFSRYPMTLAKFDGGEVREFHLELINIAQRSLLLGILLAIVFYVFGPIGIRLAAGEEYQYTNLVCGIAALHFVMMALVRVFTFHYKAHRISSRLTAQSVLASIPFVAAAVTLIPQFGLLGAVGTALIWSTTLVCLMFIEFTKNVEEIKTR